MLLPMMSPSAIWRAVRSTRRLTSSAGMPMFSQPKATSLSTSTQKNWLRGFWKTFPTTRPVWQRGAIRTSDPSTSTLPWTVAWSKCVASPFIRRVSVVLPAPEAPQTRTAWPSGMVRLMPLRTGLAAPLYVSVTLSKTIT